MITNLQLLDFCRQALGREYWWGTFGNKATSDLLAAKRKQYPNYYNRASYSRGWTCDGKPVFDCIGFAVKGPIWCNGVYGATPKYNASQDVNVGGMIDRCTKKGKISTMPDVPGTLVFIERHHVGVYEGRDANGVQWVLEARGHDYGCVRTKLSGRGWDSWGYCPWITYVNSDSKVETTKTETKPATKKSVEEVAKDVINGKYGDGSQRKKKLQAEGYNYAEVQAMVNKLINAKTLKVGSKVKIKAGAKSYNGKMVAPWVYLKTYTVDELKGDRAVLDKNGICTAFNIKDLTIQ